MASDSQFISRLLDFLQYELIPATQEAVARGNKMFGGGMLRKSDLSTVIIGTNNEIENPLWHGEVHTIKLFCEMPREKRPRPEEILFVASHEPCTLCLSAITWAGYDNFYYLFSHEDSRDSFNIGHDLRILKEVFGLEPAGYRRENAYWRGEGIRDLIAECDELQRRALSARVAEIAAEYGRLSDIYQVGRENNDIPLK